MAHRFLLLLLMLGLFAPALAAQSVPQAVVPPAPPVVTLADLPSKNLYSIHGIFGTASAPEAVWAVLSDYQGLAGIVRGLKSSRVLERKGSEALIEQVMEGHFLFFGKALDLRLRVLEQEPKLIEFFAASPKPFRHYQGSWTITPTPSGCRVDYRLEVSRGDVAPRFVERRLFKTNSMDLMLDLSREVGRRAGNFEVPASAIATAVSATASGNFGRKPREP